MSLIFRALFKASMAYNSFFSKQIEKLRERPPQRAESREDDMTDLDRLARKDLLASISFFEEGIQYMYVFLEKARSTSERGTVTAKAAAETATFEILERLPLQLTALDESATRILDSAKDRFKYANWKATEAFANEALKLSDRLLAMKYRILATVLENVDSPQHTLTSCRMYIEEIHRMPAVQQSFNVELQKGFRAHFNKHERREIISTVCYVNCVFYDITQMLRRTGEIFPWPCVDTEEGEVDPLRDRRIVEVLKKQGVEHCLVNPWSFGQDGEEDDKLKDPSGNTTNTHDEDNTVGIDVDPSHFKVSSEIWRPGENDQATNDIEATSFEHHVARLVAEKLKEEKRDVKSSSSSTKAAGLPAPSTETSRDATESIHTSKDSKVDVRKSVLETSFDPTQWKEEHSPLALPEISYERTIDESGGRLLAREGGNDEKLLTLPESLLSQNCDSKEVVLQLKHYMQLDQASLEQPDPGTKRLIRCLAVKAKESGRVDVVKHLREITPAGTTGPLLPERLDIRNIPVRQMKELTIELSGGEDWKLVAEELGLTPQEIRFLDKRTLNPCEAVLAFISRQRDVSVGSLYDGLNKCGLPVTADIL